MKRVPLWLAAPLLLCSLGAQDQPAPSGDASSRLKELQAEQNTIVAAWQKQRADYARLADQAKSDGTQIPAMPMRPDFAAVRSKFVAAAADFPGQDAVQFLVPALQMGNTGEQQREVLDLLLNEHLDHLAGKDATQLGSMLQYLDRIVDADYSVAALARIEQHGKNAALLAWVAFARNEKTLRTEPVKSQAFLDAKTTVAAALAKADEKGLARQFESLLAEQERFGIGMAAPDIEGVDLDGVAFKLSDYKGKVVFLDFWGDW